MWELRKLLDYVNRSTWTEIDGLRMPRRPASNPTRLERLKSAVAVYRMKAEAFRWPGGQ